MVTHTTRQAGVSQGRLGVQALMGQARSSKEAVIGEAAERGHGAMVPGRQAETLHSALGRAEAPSRMGGPHL